MWDEGKRFMVMRPKYIIAAQCKYVDEQYCIAFPSHFGLSTGVLEYYLYPSNI